MFGVFPKNNKNKILPEPRFSKPIFGHCAGQLNWVGPIAKSCKLLFPEQWEMLQEPQDLERVVNKARDVLQTGMG